jgi:hypothetical protein
VSEAFRKTLTREMEALEDHLGDRRTLQMGRVRLGEVSTGHHICVMIDEEPRQARELVRRVAIA